MQRRNKPEVLAPAGNLRGLKTAVDYGADAVYCGGKAFGMRSAPKNLSLEDFEEGARYAHERGARVYVTFNVLPRNNEVEAMREYLGQLKDTGVDALIVSDIGVMLMARTENLLSAPPANKSRSPNKLPLLKRFSMTDESTPGTGM